MAARPTNTRLDIGAFSSSVSATKAGRSCSRATRVSAHVVIASAILDRLLHHAATVHIKGDAYTSARRARLASSARPSPLHESDELTGWGL